MADITTATQVDILKHDYLPVAQEQLNNKVSPWYTRLEKSTKHVYGDKIIKAITYGQSGGVSTAAETSNYPTSGGTYPKQFEVVTKNLFGILDISKKAKKASENNRGSFVNLVTQQVKALTNSLSLNVDRQLYGDGTGIITQVNHGGGYSGATAIVVDDETNLMEGMIVDILNHSSHAVEADAVRITDVNRSNHTITIGTSSTVTDDADICIQDSYNLEMTGLNAIFSDTGNIYNLSRTTYSWLVPYMLGSIGVLDELDIQKAIDYVNDFTIGDIDFLVCSPGVRRSYQQLMGSLRRNIEPMTLEGGFKTMSYNGIPLLGTRRVGAGKMMGLTTKYFFEGNMGDWEWDNEGGASLRGLEDKNVLRGTLSKFADIIDEVPGANFELSGITEDDGIA